MVYVYDDIDGGSDSVGDDPSACDYESDPTDQFCIEGGSTFPPNSISVLNPCDQPDPPDYCSEAGSCFDKTIADEYDRAIIRSLEDEGRLTELWQKSNADATDQSKREERGA